MIKLLKNVVAFLFIAGVSSAIGQQITGGGGGGVSFPMNAGAGTAAAPSINFGVGACGVYGVTTGQPVNSFSAGCSTPSFYFAQAVLGAVSNGIISWHDQINTFAGSGPDTGVKRNAAGVVEANNGTACSTASNCREFMGRSYVSRGTVPGISGCSAGTQTGGATAGTFTIGAATCNVTLTFAFTAATGWSCAVNDRTTAAAAGLVHVTSSSTTTAVISVPATAVISDVVDFHCMAY